MTDRFEPHIGNRRGSAHEAARPAQEPRVEPVLWWRTAELERVGITGWLDAQYRAGRLFVTARQELPTGRWTIYAARTDRGEPEVKWGLSPWVLGPMVAAWPHADAFGPKTAWEDRGSVGGWLLAEKERDAPPMAELQLSDRFSHVLGDRRGPLAGGPLSWATRTEETWWLWDYPQHFGLCSWLADRVAENYLRLRLAATDQAPEFRVTVEDGAPPKRLEVHITEMLWLLDHWPGVLRDSSERDSDQVAGWLTYAAARNSGRRAGFLLPAS